MDEWVGRQADRQKERQSKKRSRSRSETEAKQKKRSDGEERRRDAEDKDKGTARARQGQSRARQGSRDSRDSADKAGHGQDKDEASAAPAKPKATPPRRRPMGIPLVHLRVICGTEAPAQECPRTANRASQLFAHSPPWGACQSTTLVASRPKLPASFDDAKGTSRSTRRSTLPNAK